VNDEPNDLERVQPDPLARAIVQLAAILSDHISEHDRGGLLRDSPDTFDVDMQALHDIRRMFDSRVVTDTYVDMDPDA
jgi:hypothetical protein